MTFPSQAQLHLRAYITWLLHLYDEQIYYITRIYIYACAYIHEQGLSSFYEPVLIYNACKCIINLNGRIHLKLGERAHIEFIAAYMVAHLIDLRYSLTRYKIY